LSGRKEQRRFRGPPASRDEAICETAAGPRRRPFFPRISPRTSRSEPAGALKTKTLRRLSPEASRTGSAVGMNDSPREKKG
jgi:hypothetical protein